MPLLAYTPPESSGSTPAAGPPPQPAYDPLSSSSYQYTEPAPDTAPPPNPDPTQSAEASYQYRADQLQATPPPATSPPPASTDKYGNGVAEQYGQMQDAARTAETAPVTGATSFGAPDPYHAVGADQYNPFPGDSGLPQDRLRRRVGAAGSWFDTPTTPGSYAAPPPDNPNRGQTDLLQGALGAGKFLANYGPGGRAPYSLPETLARDFAPWSPENAKALTDGMTPNSPTALPDWLRWAVATGRYLWYDNPEATPYETQIGGGGYNPMDQTDAYLGNDSQYLRYMASMPEYLTRFRPLAAQAAHQIAKAPGIPWQPPYIPGMEPTQEPDIMALPGGPRENRLYPEAGIYYDDPYIPGPDHTRRRRTA